MSSPEKVARPIPGLRGLVFCAPDLGALEDPAETEVLPGKGTGSRGSPPPRTLVQQRRQSHARPGRTEASGAPRGQASGQGGWERAGWAGTEFLLNQPHFPGASDLTGAQSRTKGGGGPLLPAEVTWVRRTRAIFPRWRLSLAVFSWAPVERWPRLERTRSFLRPLRTCSRSAACCAQEPRP